MRTILYSTLAALIIVSAGAAFNLSLFWQSRASSRDQTCSAFQAYNATFIRLINQGERSLPAITYYKQHPDEMEAAIRQDETAKKLLTDSLPAYC